MNHLLVNTTRSINLRLIIALLLGLFLVLGVHANDLTADRDRCNDAAISEAWPVRVSHKK